MTMKGFTCHFLAISFLILTSMILVSGCTRKKDLISDHRKAIEAELPSLAPNEIMTDVSNRIEQVASGMSLDECINVLGLAELPREAHMGIGGLQYWYRSEDKTIDLFLHFGAVANETSIVTEIGYFANGTEMRINLLD